jgi:putative ABC transport system permease protein
MFKNYLISAIRNLKKQKMFALINVFGLAFGLAGFAIFALTAGVKSNADRFLKNLDRIYSLVQVLPAENKKSEAATAFLPGPLLPALAAESPEIERGVRVRPLGRLIVKNEKDSFFQGGAYLADPGFLLLFDFPMKAGKRESALAEPSSVVLTEAAAEKYFGRENPLGRVLTLEKSTRATVTGILKNIPRTSSLNFEMLVSMETARPLSVRLDDWTDRSDGIFVLLGKDARRERLEEAFARTIDRSPIPPDRKPVRTFLFPYKDFRLKGSWIETFMATSHPTAVFIGLFLGALLLLIVSINFINLSTARSMHRFKEIGMRQVVGASRKQLVTQFLAESLLLSCFALPLGVLIHELCYPFLTSRFGSFLGTDQAVQVSNSILNYPFLWKNLVIATLLTGLLSGLYPALYLSSLRPVQALKGSQGSRGKKRRGAKALIVVQFTLSILFIAGAGILRDQGRRIMSADFGFSRDRVAFLPLPAEGRSARELIKREAALHPEIESVSASAGLPLIWSALSPVRAAEGSREDAVEMEVYAVDFDFVETLGLTMRRGRSFRRENGDGRGFILTETAAAKLPWDDPLGRTLAIGDKTGPVLGIVKDFLFDDIGFSIPPAVLSLDPERTSFLLFKYAADYPAVRSILERLWRKYVPDVPFQASTLEFRFQTTLGLINKVSDLINLVGLMAVLFSSFGLLGLVAFMLERRVKEIGIRKALGASFSRIIWQVTKGYLVPVAVSNAIALILVYIGWRKVLQTGLVFLTPIGPGVYLGALAVSMIAAAAAVVSKSWRTARANPADSLRLE